LKKIYFIFFLLFAFGISSCGHEYIQSNDRGSVRLYQTFAYSAAEYGETGCIENFEGPLYASISYPKSIGFAEEAVNSWVYEIYNQKSEQLNKLREINPEAVGEIYLQYNAFLLNGKYAGIIINGIYNEAGMSESSDIIKTFNLDLENERFVGISEVINMDDPAKIFSLLRERILHEYPDTYTYSHRLYNISDAWLDNWVTGHNGIIVVLARGIFMPEFFGTLTVTLPYEDLDLILFSKTIPVPDPEPDPVTEPEPKIEFTEEDVIESNKKIIDTDRPFIALTFDDGPSQHTARILDILEDYGIVASFCVMGRYVEAESETVLRAFQMGCEIIGHSWGHPDYTLLSEASIKKQIQDTEDIIRSVTGADPPLIHRPPYGAINNRVKKVSADMGYSLLSWSVDPKDWESRDADLIYNYIVRYTRDRAVVLFHDIYAPTADALERIIPKLMEDGFQFVTVSDLFLYSDVELIPGEIYRNAEKK